MSQPPLSMRMPLYEFITRCRSDYSLENLYHVVDDLGGGRGLEHFAYDFADKAAADAYHAGLAAFISKQVIDANNSRVLRSTDAAYVAGAGAAVPSEVVTFSQFNKGASVVLSAGGFAASITDTQEMVRATLGRDRANGGVYEWEIVSSVAPNGLRPQFGVVRGDANCAIQALAFTSPLAWLFGEGSAGLEPCYRWNNGVVAGGNWDIGGTSHGGEAKTYTMKLDMGTGAFSLKRNGVAQLLPFAGVGAGAPAGTLLYPFFGTGSGGPCVENGTIRFTGLTYPSVGATPWLGR